MDSKLGDLWWEAHVAERWTPVPGSLETTHDLYLLLDEPVSNQDVGSLQSIAGMLAVENVPMVGIAGAPLAPLTVLATTHNLSLMEHFTHVAYLSNGRVVESGKKEEVMARKGHVYRRIHSQAGLYIDRRGQAVVTVERLRQIWLFHAVESDEALKALKN